MSLLAHVLDVCDDPDCEIHQIEVGLAEDTVRDSDLAFYIAGAYAMELAIRREFARLPGGLDVNARRRLTTACLHAGREIHRLGRERLYQS